MKIFTIAPVANPDELEGYGGLYCETCASETDAQNMASACEPVIYREVAVTYHGWHAETCDMCGVELSAAITVPASRDHKGARFDLVDDLPPVEYACPNGHAYQRQPGTVEPCAVCGEPLAPRD